MPKILTAEHQDGSKLRLKGGNMAKFIGVGIYLIGLGLTGCVGVFGHNDLNTSKIPVASLLSSVQCAGSGIGATALWVADPKNLDPSLSEQIAAMNASTFPWDSETEGVLIVSMGRQPTGGYRLTLDSPFARVQRGGAIVRISWHRPAVGAIVTQATTSPCLILKLPKKGLKMIYVQDQEGRVRAETTVRD